MTLPEALAPGSSADQSDTGDALESAQTVEVIALCALIAGFGAGFSGTAPTGTPWWDVVLSTGLAIAFVVAGARASRTVLIGAAGLAATFVGLTPWLIFAVGGFAAALGAELGRRRIIELQAAGAALTFLALLHLRSVGFFGLSALLAGVAIVAVLVSGYRRFGDTSQGRIRRGLQFAAVLLVVVAAISVIVGLSLRSSADAGVTAAREGLAAARAGDTAELTAQLERAQEELQQANDTINSPLLSPLSYVPIAAQHLRSFSTATEQASIVASEALATTRDVDVESLQLRQGQFDLDLLASLAPQLQTTALRLEEATRAIEADRSPWLLPLVDDQLQSLVDEVVEVLPEARLAASAAEVVPGLLGADGERRYLMLFGSPGESREFGGFVGGYALLGIQGGSLNLVASGSINDLVDSDNKDPLDDPSSYPVEYVAVDPGVFPQNLTSTPNIFLIARAVQDVFPELHGRPIDGVVYADPYALAALTEFTGPVAIDGVGDPLDRNGFVDFMFRGQYEAFDGRQDRFGAMSALAAATAESLARSDLPGPERLGEVLGPLARAGRLQVVTYDDRENQFLASVKLQRNFVAPTEVDSFAVLQTNSTASKLDLYLHRDIRYDLTVGPDGGLTGVIDVELRSEIPVDVPPLTFGETTGTNLVLLSLYSRHELTDITVDGEPHQFVTHEEFGFFRYALFEVAVAPNQSVSVRFEVAGVVPEGEYRVGLWHQPLVNNDQVEVIYREPDTEAVRQQRELVETWLFDPHNAAPG